MYCATYKTDKPPVLSIREGNVSLRRGNLKQSAFVKANADRFLSGELRYSCKKAGKKKYVCGTNEDVNGAIGLGDILHFVFKKIGVNKALKRAGVRECGCQKRRERLNKITVRI